ncbi:MAG: YgjV family protein [Clostridiales bacterium]|nr:YgjV family protein [Clostridiales bacterium]
MYNYTLSFIAGLLAMLCACISYFVKKKAIFLVLQALAIIFLAVSCLFNVQYYACISYGLSLVRVFIYYIFERKDKPIKLWISGIFALLVVISYVLTNIIILQNYGAVDLLILIANLMYTFVFAMRNMCKLRLCFIPPTIISIVYFILSHATPFVIISYCFELVANTVAIILYQKRKKTAVK